MRSNLISYYLPCLTLCSFFVIQNLNRAMTRVHYATDPTSDMHWPVRIFYVVLTALHTVEATSSASHDQGPIQGPGLVANWNDHSMRRNAAGGGIPGGGRKNLPISLGFKCAYCRGEFGSRAGMD